MTEFHKKKKTHNNTSTKFTVEFHREPCPEFMTAFDRESCNTPPPPDFMQHFNMALFVQSFFSTKYMYGIAYNFSIPSIKVNCYYTK